MNSQIDEKIRFFSEKLRERLGSNISKIILFGSRARGDFADGSDYDFVIILKEKKNDYVNRIRDTEIDFLNRFDLLSSSLIYSEVDWKKREKLPIGINVEREGIIL